MYAGTIMEWEDKSAVERVTPDPTDDTPLFMTAFSSERGPEDMRIVKGKTFYDLYGNDISFAKHGQPLLQAANIIDNGGKLLCKRVVAADSKLANIIIIAKVTSGTKQKLDPITGKPLYVQADDTISDVVSATPANETFAKIKYTAKSVEDASFYDEVHNICEDPTIYTPDGVEEGEDGNKVLTFSYPIFVGAENGRGASVKKIRVKADYDLSKNLGFCIYNMIILNGTVAMETTRFTGDPEVIYNKTNMSISNMSTRFLNQAIVKSDEVIMLNFIKKISEFSNLTEDEVKSIDFIFGKNRKGVKLSGIEIDDTGLDIGSEYGVNLLSGEDGKFLENLTDTEEYCDELVKFYDGTFTDDIYDRDTYKIAAIIDCNYPVPVKRAIEQLVAWREDTMFFEDVGLNINTYAAVTVAAGDMLPSRFVAGYLTSYDIVDPYTLKQISVTMMYDFAVLLIEHIRTNAFRPLAGIANNMVLTSAIEGSINFTPKIIPGVNQKELLEDDRINYAIMINNKLVIETEYTTQNSYTQLSFINNVLAIEEVARKVRDVCPTVRYKFIDGGDLEIYKKAVQDVINPFCANFKELNFVYVEDPVMVSNKIFKAAFEFRFFNFAQTEIFTLFALGDAA